MTLTEKSERCKIYSRYHKNDFQYEVSEKLAQNGMVVSASAWSGWMDKHYPKFEYTNGEYYMSADMSYEDIVNKLNNPDISHKIVKVCVPEGTNAMQISKLMEENGICSADDFLSACKRRAITIMIFFLRYLIRI